MPEHTVDYRETHTPYRRTVEGITRWMRSERQGGDQCLCCDGPHVFGYDLVLDPPQPCAWRGSGLANATDWLHVVTREAPEGARLRITVEVVNAD
jgi:hypothetical protein